MQTIIIDTDEKDEWIRQGKGYQDEVAICEQAFSTARTALKSTKDKTARKYPRKRITLRKTAKNNLSGNV